MTQKLQAVSSLDHLFQDALHVLPLSAALQYEKGLCFKEH